MPDRFTVVPASYLYLLREGDHGTEVLLQLRQGTGYMDGHWAAAAAGHVERRESAVDAVRRETAEELGLSGIEPVFELTMQRTQGGAAIDERVDFFSTCRSWVGEPRLMEPDKAAELGWFPLTALPDPTVPHEQVALTHLGGSTRFLALGF